MRHTRSHRDNRRAHHALESASLIACEKCGTKKMKHVACTNCGIYKGRQVIDVHAKIHKKETKKKERESTTKTNEK